MSWKIRFKDSFLFGLIIGAITLVSFYFLIDIVRLQLILYYGNPYLLKPPAVQLFAAVANVLVFRYVMIAKGKEEAGKGILFITVISMAVYFVVYFRLFHQG